MYCVLWQVQKDEAIEVFLIDMLFLSRSSVAAPTLTCAPQVGAVFTMGFSLDAPYLLAVGGAKGSVTVWDVRAVPAVTAKFPGLLQQGKGGAGAAAPTQ